MPNQQIPDKNKVSLTGPYSVGGLGIFIGIIAMIVAIIGLFFIYSNLNNKITKLTKEIGTSGTGTSGTCICPPGSCVCPTGSCSCGNSGSSGSSGGTCNCSTSQINTALISSGYLSPASVQILPTNISANPGDNIFYYGNTKNGNISTKLTLGSTFSSTSVAHYTIYNNSLSNNSIQISINVTGSSTLANTFNINGIMSNINGIFYITSSQALNIDIVGINVLVSVINIAVPYISNGQTNIDTLTLKNYQYGKFISVSCGNTIYPRDGVVYNFNGNTGCTNASTTKNTNSTTWYITIASDGYVSACSFIISNFSAYQTTFIIDGSYKTVNSAVLTAGSNNTLNLNHGQSMLCIQENTTTLNYSIIN